MNNNLFIEGLSKDIEYIEAKVAYESASESLSSLTKDNVYAESLGGLFTAGKLIDIVLKLMSGLLIVLKKIYIIVIGVILKKLVSISHRSSSAGSSLSSLASTSGLVKGKTYTIPYNVVDADTSKGLESIIPNDIASEASPIPVPLGANNEIERKCAILKETILQSLINVESIAKNDLYKFLERGRFEDTKSAMFNILFVSLNSKLQSMTEDTDINSILLSMEEYNKFINNLVLFRQHKSGFTNKLIYFSYKDSYDILNKVAHNSNDVKPFHTMKEIVQKDISELSKVNFFDNMTFESIYANIYKGITGESNSDIKTIVPFVNQYLVDMLRNGLEMTKVLSDFFDSTYKNLYMISAENKLERIHNTMDTYFESLSKTNPFKQRKRNVESAIRAKRNYSMEIVSDYASNFFFKKLISLHDTNIKDRLKVYNDLTVMSNIKDNKCNGSLRLIKESLNRLHGDSKSIKVSNPNDVTVRLIPFRKDTRYTNIFVVPTKLEHENEVRSYPTAQYYAAEDFLKRCDMTKDSLRDAVSRVSQSASHQIKEIKEAQSKIKNSNNGDDVRDREKATLSSICTTVTSVLNIIESGATAAHNVSMVHFETINNKIVDLYVANYKLIIECMMKKLGENIMREY